MPVLDSIAQGARAQGDRLADVIGRAARRLAQAGVETPGLDARRLVAAVTGLGAAELIAQANAPVSEAACRRLEALIARRCAREPVSRILGERAFFGRSFAITPATLDPRPDSETLIETALEIVNAAGRSNERLRLLDVGTGSGCLLVTLLAELPLSTGVGTDVSPGALAVAAENARRHGVADRARFEHGEAPDRVNGSFDLLVCNPPYVASDEIDGLAPEVRNYDPRQALDGGADGLDVYRRIMPVLLDVVPCGWALFEVGAGQAKAVAALLREAVPERRRGPLVCRKDINGHVRCVAMEIQL